MGCNARIAMACCSMAMPAGGRQSTGQRKLNHMIAAKNGSNSQISEGQLSYHFCLIFSRLMAIGLMLAAKHRTTFPCPSASWRVIPWKLRSVHLFHEHLSIATWVCRGVSRETIALEDLAEQEARDGGEAANPGRAPHHAGGRRPANVGGFLGGRARHAAGVRAAQPRRSRDQPPLFRPRRRPAHHRIHARG